MTNTNNSLPTKEKGRNVPASAIHEQEAHIRKHATEQTRALELDNRQREIRNETLLANKEMREMLMPRLQAVSICWLILTAAVVIALGFKTCFRLSDAVAVAFITTSLATVLGLWVFGLKYFFDPEK